MTLPLYFVIAALIRLIIGAISVIAGAAIGLLLTFSFIAL
jgi:hypothetical protein